jgi:hypothetical protein
MLRLQRANKFATCASRQAFDDEGQVDGLETGRKDIAAGAQFLCGCGNSSKDCLWLLETHVTTFGPLPTCYSGSSTPNNSAVDRNSVESAEGEQTQAKGCRDGKLMVTSGQRIP